MRYVIGLSSLVSPSVPYRPVLADHPTGSHSEEAVEFEELDQFLRLKEDWKPFDDEKPLLRAVPVGVPGAYSPAQMNPEHISPAPSPVRSKPPPARRDGEVDAGEHLEDASLRGINVTEDDLLKLVEELGMDGADADELVKGLKGEETPVKEEESKEVVQPEAALKEEPVKEKPEAQAEAEQADESKVEEAKAEAEEAKAKEMEADVNAPVESQAGGSTKTEPVLAVSDVSADKVGPDATNAVEEPAHA